MKSETSIGGGLGDLAVEGLETQVDGAGDEVADEDEDVDESSSTADGQVWSLTQFYSVDFSQSRISGNKFKKPFKDPKWRRGSCWEERKKIVFPR